MMTLPAFFRLATPGKREPVKSHHVLPLVRPRHSAPNGKRGRVEVYDLPMAVVGQNRVVESVDSLRTVMGEPIPGTTVTLIAQDQVMVIWQKKSRGLDHYHLYCKLVKVVQLEPIKVLPNIPTPAEVAKLLAEQPLQVTMFLDEIADALRDSDVVREKLTANGSFKFSCKDLTDLDATQVSDALTSAGWQVTRGFALGEQIHTFVLTPPKVE